MSKDMWSKSWAVASEAESVDANLSHKFHFPCGDSYVLHDHLSYSGSSHWSMDGFYVNLTPPSVYSSCDFGQYDLTTITGTEMCFTTNPVGYALLAESTSTDPCGVSVTTRVFGYNAFNGFMRIVQKETGTADYGNEYTTGEVIGNAYQCAVDGVISTSFGCGACLVPKPQWTFNVDDGVSATIKVGRWRLLIDGTVEGKQYCITLYYERKSGGAWVAAGTSKRFVRSATSSTWYYPSVLGEVFGPPNTNPVCNRRMEVRLARATITGI